MAGQFVPFWRQTFDPPTVRDEPIAKFEPVAFSKLKVAMVPVVELRLFTYSVVPVAPLNVRYVAKRFVDVVFVPVAFTQVRFVGLKFVTLKFVKVAFVPVMFVNVPFVTKRFVPVAEVHETVFRLVVPVTVRFVSAWFTPVALRLMIS